MSHFAMSWLAHDFSNFLSEKFKIKLVTSFIYLLYLRTTLFLNYSVPLSLVTLVDPPGDLSDAYSLSREATVMQFGNLDHNFHVSKVVGGWVGELVFLFRSCLHFDNYIERKDVREK